MCGCDGSACDAARMSCNRRGCLEEHSVLAASSSKFGCNLRASFAALRDRHAGPRSRRMRIVSLATAPYINGSGWRGREAREPRQAKSEGEVPMVAVIERETASEAIEATVNYVVNNGEKLFTETAGPGGSDVRTGGTVDPRRVSIHNARVHAQPFALDREGFRFVRHD